MSRHAAPQYDTALAFAKQRNLVVDEATLVLVHSGGDGPARGIKRLSRRPQPSPGGFSPGAKLSAVVASSIRGYRAGNDLMHFLFVGLWLLCVRGAASPSRSVALAPGEVAPRPRRRRRDPPRADPPGPRPPTRGFAAIPRPATRTRDPDSRRRQRPSASPRLGPRPHSITATRAQPPAPRGVTATVATPQVDVWVTALRRLSGRTAARLPWFSYMGFTSRLSGRNISALAARLSKAHDRVVVSGWPLCSEVPLAVTLVSNVLGLRLFS